MTLPTLSGGARVERRVPLSVCLLAMIGAAIVGAALFYFLFVPYNNAQEVRSLVDHCYIQDQGGRAAPCPTP